MVILHLKVELSLLKTQRRNFNSLTIQKRLHINVCTLRKNRIVSVINLMGNLIHLHSICKTVLGVRFLSITGKIIEIVEKYWCCVAFVYNIT